jgi:hypothetical protein
MTATIAPAVQLHDGGIADALKDAQKKEASYKAEAIKIQAEAEKWAAIREKLESALDIVSGKTNAAGIPKRPAGAKKWPPIILEKLAGGPINKHELHRYLVDKGCPTEMAAYQAVHGQLKRGLILREGDMIRAREKPKTE